ncbi:hypothetical protein HMP0721_2003 [Pseudoramibacter alactolyticus ATCC 23263]|jgi:uncharacterized protein YoxC|uniref:DUF948 domain-containing protein n=1 Tax=Pseudoramibacter alactolyticus ATCC 23263 TaxID=887929 RepID=E6MJ18_9FIRM|nr:DUF948 domain-containing protein [Pseudoramibacter alactolyticus]EFV00838.1 hypothetical protein HMP0721_2003 [Pseudoramibacter alactolyticus ATCC 23263]MBM6968406.1 DUF948 domain-containing protein [Pseudoramibacter alactolyticus]
MIHISMHWWELALIIIAIAVIYGTVHLVRVFKNLVETLKRVNHLLADNEEQVTHIVTNVDSVMEDAKTSVDTVKNDVIEPLSANVGKFISIFRRLNASGERKANKREKKLEKATRRAERAAARQK